MKKKNFLRIKNGNVELINNQVQRIKTYYSKRNAKRVDWYEQDKENSEQRLKLAEKRYKASRRRLIKAQIGVYTYWVLAIIDVFKVFKLDYLYIILFFIAITISTIEYQNTILLVFNIETSIYYLMALQSFLGLFFLIKGAIRHEMGTVLVGGIMVFSGVTAPFTNPVLSIIFIFITGSLRVKYSPVTILNEIGKSSGL